MDRLTTAIVVNRVFGGRADGAHRNCASRGLNLLHWITAGACIVSVTIYGLGGIRWFRAPRGRGGATSVVTVSFLLATGANVSVTVMSPPHPALFLPAILLYIASLILYFAALNANKHRALTVAFAKDQPDHLVQSGPYKYIRHPYYAAYCSAWLAGAIAAESLLLAFVAAGMFALYWIAARAEERKFQRSPLASEYAMYMRRTGMFLPRWFRSSAPLATQRQVRSEPR